MNIPSYVLRPLSVLLTFSITTLAIPMQPFAEAFHAMEKANAERAKNAPNPVISRVLTLAEMKSLKGKTGKNPYAAGSAKYAPQYKGVDLLTGNFSTSATDLSFEGGYGVPVNVTRSYSSNNADEGPLGEGWNLSVDLRSTAGGLLKSGSAPVRMVPVEMQERPRGQTRPGALGPDVPAVDPNAVAVGAPVEAVIATTASGEEVTIQKDVDGILTPPSWDQNVYENEYEEIVRVIPGQEMPTVYRVLKSQVVITPEGTRYEYAKLGRYVYGVTKYDNPGGVLTAQSDANEPSNILKIKKVIDRHGNATEYTYKIAAWAEPSSLTTPGVPTLTAAADQANYAIFKKSNGYVVEAKLTKIKMQPDREISFEWGTYGAPYNRISRAMDNGEGAEQRIVKYAYTNGNLTSFKTAENYETNYGYGPAGDHFGGPAPDNSVLLLNSITDSRDMTTTLDYCVKSHVITGDTRIEPFRIVSPQGNVTYFGTNNGYISEQQGVVREYRGTPAEDREMCTLRVLADYNHGLNAIKISTSRWGDNLNATFDEDESEFVHIKEDKIYDKTTQNLLTASTHNWSRYLSDDYQGQNQKHIIRRAWANTDSSYTSNPQHLNSTTTKSYNVFGNPLSQTTTESRTQWGNTLSSRTTSVNYSYWGREKYFQQKAVWSTDANRYSFTDYFTSDAAVGKKGQTRAVYSQGLDAVGTTGGNKNVWGNSDNWVVDINMNLSHIDTDKHWRYKHPELQQEGNQNPILPGNLVGGKPIPSAMFDYDEKGRAKEVYKLSKITNGNPQYVTTLSEYDNAPGGYNTHGVAWRVTEAAGSSVQRQTETIEMDLAGRATRVKDANGRIFVTDYDRDGRTLTVDQVHPVQASVSVTTYGPATPRNALSGVPGIVLSPSMTVFIDYETDPQSGGAYGQVTHVNKWCEYSGSGVTYEYDALGNRTQMKLTTGYGDTQVMKYSDYIAVGSPLQQSYAYQTMSRMTLDSSGNIKYTPEEFHYLYDSSGRILETAFAQTPNADYANLDGGTVNNNSSWYDDQNGQVKLAQSRARTVYNYDEGGRLTTLETFWDTLNGNSYTSSSVRKAGYTYEKTGKNRGLKKTYRLYANGGTSPTVSEDYQYHDELDYLTGATYADQTSANGTWSYDASGNRANSGYVYDELNRMTRSSTTVGYTHDNVGNRTAKLRVTGAAPATMAAYSWNAQNQLESVSNWKNEGTFTYFYQPDGLRYAKVTANKPESEESNTTEGPKISDQATIYHYDGQMGVAEEYIYTLDRDTSNAIDAVDFAQNIVGPRGIEMQRTKKHNQNWEEQYPVYDGHGNMISNLKITRPALAVPSGETFARYAGTTTWQTGGDRKYDVWGAVRGGNTTGYPNNRYCANLGHVVDDETALIYMRARYYEPGTGRFISEDSARDGWNWYGYAKNNPVNFVDTTGCSASGMAILGASFSVLATILGFGMGVSALTGGASLSSTIILGGIIGICIYGAASCYAAALAGIEDPGSKEFVKLLGGIGAAAVAFSALIVTMKKGIEGLKGLSLFAGALGFGVAIKMIDYSMQLLGALLLISVDELDR